MMEAAPLAPLTRVIPMKTPSRLLLPLKHSRRQTRKQLRKWRRKIRRPRKSRLRKTKTLNKRRKQLLPIPRPQTNLQRQRKRQQAHLRGPKKPKVRFQIKLLQQLKDRAQHWHNHHRWRRASLIRPRLAQKKCKRKRQRKKFKRRKMTKIRTSGRSRMILTSLWQRRGLERSSLTYLNHWWITRLFSSRKSSSILWSSYMICRIEWTLSSTLFTRQKTLTTASLTSTTSSPSSRPPESKT